MAKMIRKLLLVGLLILPIVVYFGFNHQNIALQFPLFIGMMAIPFTFRFERKKADYRFAIVALLIGGALIFLRSSSLYYFLSMFLLFFMVEKRVGRINWIPVILMLVVSPVSSNIVYIWSFPIRLKLSEWAGEVLRFATFDIQVQGNVINFDGQPFSVDPACIGLNMVITALVMSLMLLAYLEKKSARNFSLSKLALLIIGVFMASVVANFVRLLTLIIFRILPENPLHDIVGLLSTIIYVLVPLYFLMRPSIELAAKENRKDGIFNFTQQEFDFKTSGGVVVLFLIQIGSGVQFLQPDKEHSSELSRIEVPNFQKTITEKGVLKLKNDSLLVYIKPPVKFYQGSHDPRFCWNGSGYKFSDVQIENIAGKEYYTAELSKQTDRLYIGWWYQDGEHQSIKDWEWRWKSMTSNGDYYMINLCAANKSTLVQALKTGIRF